MPLAAPTTSKRLPICGDGKPHPGRRMTGAEFMEWMDEDTRAEWVDGEVVMMAPASVDHVDFSGRLNSLIREFVEHHDLGRVLGTEVLVRLPRQLRKRLPDLLFVAKQREAIIKKTLIDGAPDLIMELVSPDSVARDWRDKYLEYARAGVREYWIIHRDTGRIEVYSLSKLGKYQQIPIQEGKLHSTVLSGFYLRVKWLLASKPPRIREVLRELGVK